MANPLAGERSADFVFQDFSLAGSIAALGDVNRDGYDDIALSRTNEDGLFQGSLLVFLGNLPPQSNFVGTVNPFLGTTTRPLSADLIVRRGDFKSLASGLRLSGLLTATAGDFNGDGETDLAIGEPSRQVTNVNSSMLDQDSRGHVSVFWSVADLLSPNEQRYSNGILERREVQLSAADVVDGQTATNQFGTLPAQPGIDLDGDRYSDLLVGATGADVFGHKLLADAGAVYAFYGSPQQFAIPNTGVETLSNKDITGSGGFVVDKGTGQPECFDVSEPDGSTHCTVFTLPADDPNTAANESEQWFRFTTLGDGSEGTQLLVRTVAEPPRTPFLAPTSDALATRAAGQTTIDRTSNSFLLSGPSQRLILEQDLSELLPYVENLDRLSSIQLQLDAELQQPFGPRAPDHLTKVGETVSSSGTLFFGSTQTDGDAEVWQSDGTSGGTTLVREISSVGGFGNFASVAELLYFTNNDGLTGIELWQSNGTFAGTRRTIDLVNGSSGSNPMNLTRVDTVLYFTAQDAQGRRQLWRLRPDQVPESLTIAGDFSNIGDLTVAGTRLFFTARRVTTSNEQLFVIDTPSASPVLIDPFPFRPSDPIPYGDVDQLTPSDSLLYFTAIRNGETELWSSDGTAVGTNLIVPLGNPSSTQVGNLTDFEGDLLFTLTDLATGRSELLRYQGNLTFETVGFFGTPPSNLTVLAGSLYFSAAEDGQSTLSLWKLDVGGARFIDAFMGTPESFTVVGNRLYVTTTSDAQPLWTLEGRSLVPLLNFPTGQIRQIGNLTPIGDRLYFTTTTAQQTDLYYTQGTAESTRLVRDTAPFRMNLAVDVGPDEGDGRITTSDVPSILPIGPAVLVPTRSGLLQIDVTDAIKTTLAEGKTRVTIAVGGLESGTSLRVNRSLFGGQTGLVTTIARQQGVLVDLFDSDGGRIAEAAEVVDMRRLEAGTYYVRVFNPFADTPAGGIPFEIEIVAPERGHPHPPDDRDVLEGGEGEDVIIGGPDLDRIFGESGDDAFVAELIEVFDLDDGEPRTDPPVGQQVRRSDLPLPIDEQVQVPDLQLAIALAEGLDIPVTTSYRNTPLLQLPFYASELNEITRLDAGSSGISHLDKLDHATNMRILNLAGNYVSELTPLQPSGRRGLTRLEFVALDGNSISDLRPLESSPNLRALSIDYNPVTDLTPLEGLGQLQFLSADGPPNTMFTLPDGNVSISSLYSGFALLDVVENPDDPQALGDFGSSIVALGGNIVVGAPTQLGRILTETGGVFVPAGAVYVLDGATGEQLLMIENPVPHFCSISAPQACDRFGESIAVLGGNIVVGAPGADLVYPDDPFMLRTVMDAGIVYVFDGSTGQPVGNPLLSPRPTAGAGFGSSLAAHGSMLVVGSPNEVRDERAGAVYVFDNMSGKLELSAVSDDNNDPGAIRNPDRGAESLGDLFGYSIAIAENHIVVGAPNDNNSGSVYVFDGATGAQPGTQRWRLSDPEVSDNDSDTGFRDAFGYALAAQGDHILVGAPRAGEPGAASSGKVYELDISDVRRGVADSGRVVRALNNPDLEGGDPSAAAIDLFGNSVAFAGDHILVGVPFDDASAVDAGGAYLFRPDGSRLHRFVNTRTLEHAGDVVAAVGTQVLLGAKDSYRSRPCADPAISLLCPGAVLVFEGAELDNLDPLGELDDLRWLSLSGNQIADVTPLTALGDLQYLYLHDNRISSIEPLASERLLDNGSLPQFANGTTTGRFVDEPGYKEQPGTTGIGNLRAVLNVIEKDYRFFPPGNGTPVATWQFTDLAPGSYEVWVTWPEHAARAETTYTVAEGVGCKVDPPVDCDVLATVPVDQRLAPVGEQLGNRPWQRILTTGPIDGGALRVQLADAPGGLVAADGVRIRSVERPQLAVLTLAGNPLDNAAHELYVDHIRAEGTRLSYDSNLSPAFLQVNSRATNLPGTVNMALQFTNPDQDPYLLTAETSHPQVGVTVSGNTLRISRDQGFIGTATIRVTIQDGPSGPGDWRGRTDHMLFDVSFDTNAIYGAKYNDPNANGVRTSDEPGLEAWQICLDTCQAGLGRQTYSDANGEYRFVNLGASTFVVTEQVQPGWRLTTMPSDLRVTFSSVGRVALQIDLGNTDRGPTENRGQKFEDLDGDGQRDPGEPVLNGWTIVLRDTQGNELARTQTTSNDLDDDGLLDPVREQGLYEFTNLSRGVYVVSEELQSGWGLSFPRLGIHIVNLTAQVNTNGLDFGNVILNHAPLLDNRGSPTLRAINEDVDDESNPGTLVSEIIGTSIRDEDPGALRGPAIIGADTSNGSWEYSINGGASWNVFGALSNTSALLVAATPNERIRFVPDRNFNGLVDPGITYHAWDQSDENVTGATGVDVSNNGGTTAYSAAVETAAITVGALNDAPVLDTSGSPALAAINEDQFGNTGTRVRDIIGSSITDADAGAVRGLAIVGIDNSNGSWQFTTEGNSADPRWVAFALIEASTGPISDTAAVLLSDADANRIRFVPAANFNGTVDPAIRFRAWDRTDGNLNGAAGIDVSANGGTTAYSSAVETASIAVNSINDAPLLDTTGNMTLSLIRQGETNNPGTLVSAIIASAGGDRITDVDAGAVEGIAVTAVDNTNGRWEYSTDNGGAWNAFGTPTATAARLLAADSQTRVRFVPSNGCFTGTVISGITFRAWDQTSGGNGATADVSTNGGSTAFSPGATETASITVSSASTVATSFQDQVFPTNEYRGTQDTEIRSSSATQNFGRQTTVVMVNNPEVVDSNADRAALLKWDLSSIPAGSTVLCVSMTLNISNSSSDVYQIYPLLKAWQELQATWNVFATGSNWSRAGAQDADGQGNLDDRSSIVVGAITAPATGFRTFVLNPAGTTVVQVWVDRPVSNNGFIIQHGGTATANDLAFRSRDHGTFAERPRLEVTYVLPQTGSAIGSDTGEQPPAAVKGTGQVTVPRVRSHRAVVRGDGGDNVIQIEQTGTDSYRVRTMYGTALNGRFEPVELTGVTTLIIDTGAGNDYVQLDGSASPITLGRHLTIKTGAGDDLVELHGTTVLGKAKIDTGAGNDIVRVVDSILSRGSLVTTGAGDDDLVVDHSTVWSPKSIRTAPGLDSLMMNDLTFASTAPRPSVLAHQEIRHIDPASIDELLAAPLDELFGAYPRPLRRRVN